MAEDLSRPTSMANFQFDMAFHNTNAHSDRTKDPADIQGTLNYISQGLSALSTGLRATYIKLEQIEALIRSQGARGR
jgi:hypothetical protein